MENVFLKYMRERVGKRQEPNKKDASPGPVITISREYGCPAQRIAQKLADTLTAKNKITTGKDVVWKWLSKEIIEESARELKLSPTLIKDLSEYKTRSFLDNLALFFSEDYYQSDAKINNTIANFIHTTAEEGNVIIVGRAAEAITKKFKKAIHIKLEAPVDWRTQTISQTFGITLSEARKEAAEMDERRSKFRHYFEKDKPDIDFYNVIFNCKDMTDDEIVEMIIILAEVRRFV